VRPRVVIHNAVSLNGVLSGFEIDLGLHYRLAGRLGCDATLRHRPLTGSRAALEGWYDTQP